ncbi:hypothetical protein B9Z55_023472 [Caenorhabditis nigoni]|uniref:Nematode cuticle collagen N-terminal domain-containing protein n=1 Tax=Caenorhabditis nigoni TaxID=1611254 RepID=A0A2G5SQC7_9PELO|nr:hypothetical protein B9Z55_023472 [Caenorhabditis nigoni]
MKLCKYVKEDVINKILNNGTTLSILSVIMIFATFPFFYAYFAKVKMELLHEMKTCKNSAVNVFNFVNEVEYFEPKRERLLDISQCQAKSERSFLLE